MNSLYDLLITQEVSAKLIGKFSKSSSGVTIKVIDKKGLEVRLEDSRCFPIADTNRWSWLMKNVSNDLDGEFSYIMTSDQGEIFEGEF